MAFKGQGLFGPALKNMKNAIAGKRTHLSWHKKPKE